jgi:hypothetical protein
VPINVTKLVAMVFAGVAGIAGLFALVVLFNEGLSLVGCTAAAPLGWTVPLVSIVVIAAAAWALMSQSEKHPGSADEFRTVACPACGGKVLTDWRLCPYCGSSVTPAPGTDRTVAPG